MKTTFSYHALIYCSYVSFYSDLYALTSSCWASTSLIGETVVLDIEVMSNVIDADIRPDYLAWQTFQEYLSGRISAAVDMRLPMEREEKGESGGTDRFLGKFKRSKVSLITVGECACDGT